MTELAGGRRDLVRKWQCGDQQQPDV